MIQVMYSLWPGLAYSSVSLPQEQKEPFESLRANGTVNYEFYGRCEVGLKVEALIYQ